MAPAKILAVDDDRAILNLVYRFLSQKGYQVEAAEDGKAALRLFEKLQPDLVVLDLNLPDTTGFKLCQEMKARKDVFVLVLTSMTGDDIILKIFEESGADDYIAKPFSLVELGVRVKAILKRQRLASQEPQRLEFGELVIDPGSREVTVNGNQISLTVLEFDLLYCLASKPNYAWKRIQLIETVWKYECGDKYIGDLQVIDVHIGRIRRKIELEPKHCFIKTVWKIGYKFEVP